MAEREAPSGASLRCALRERRAAAGMSQVELAERVGVSRQALVAIEAGRQVPATTLALLLAQALHCAVEDLFALPAGPRLSALLASSATHMHAHGRLVIGNVEGQWVAHSLERDDRAADGLVVEEKGGSVAVEPLCELADLERNVLVVGCAPLLGLLSDRLGTRHGGARGTWIPATSSRALELLERRLVHVAGLHLAAGESATGHARIVRQRFPERGMVLINLTRWQQGLVVPKGNPLGIRVVDDLLRTDVRVVRRDQGAGAQQLLERLLAAKTSHVDQALSGGPLAFDHAEVANLVRFGLADVGVAIEAVALSHGLDFIPLAEERFDLVAPQSALQSRPVARLLELVGRSQFKADAQRLAGYDLSLSGHAATVGGN